jgi:AcrR family transcriptional regulator
MLYDKGLFVAVTHIRLADVAKEADLTTGAAYRIWERQDDFHRDLAVAAVRHREIVSIQATFDRIHQAIADKAPLAEVLRLGALAGLYNTQGPNDPFLITLALRAASGNVPELAEASRLRHTESMAAFEELYGALLHHYRRRMRPPFGIEALSHSLAALSEGFAMQTMSGVAHPSYELDGFDPMVGREWTLLGIAVETLVDRLTIEI